jgi:NAD(P)-dependent dehydrogenase (short-subunit alcohol dehydrogenase family)
VTALRFDDRVAVITGSGRGLGREYALLMASRGARIVVNDNGSSLTGEGSDAGPANQVVEEIRALGGEAVAVTDSVATPEGGRAIVEAALDSFGRIDVLIHNAGNSVFHPLATITHEDFRKVVDIHLLGGFNVVQPAFPRMVAAGYGRVVLTGSIGGIYTMPTVAGYAVAKSGLIGLNNIVAIEGAEHGVKSNIILPGASTRMVEGIDTTGFPPMGPEMVAPVVGWLAHESCSVSGEMLISAAGRVARAFVAETEGVYAPDWTIESVAERIGAIRDPARQWTFHPAENGFGQHLERSFAMALGAKAG